MLRKRIGRSQVGKAGKEGFDELKIVARDLGGVVVGSL